MHPRMARMVAEELEWLRSHGTQVAVVEAALLFEAGWDTLVDEVWATDAPLETVIQRLQARSGMSAEEVMTRVESPDGSFREAGPGRRGCKQFRRRGGSRKNSAQPVG